MRLFGPKSDQFRLFRAKKSYHLILVKLNHLHKEIQTYSDLTDKNIDLLRYFNKKIVRLTLLKGVGGAAFLRFGVGVPKPPILSSFIHSSYLKQIMKFHLKFESHQEILIYPYFQVTLS